MMPKKIVFVALAFSLLTAEIVSRSTTKSTKPTSSEKTIAQPAHDSQEDIDGLKKDLANLQVQLQRLAASRSDLSQAETETPAKENKEDLSKEDQDPVKSPAEQGAFLAHQFELKYTSQSDDPEWSMDTENAIQDLFTNESFDGAQLGSVDCQSSLCRLELNYDSENARDEFLAKAAHTEPLNTEGFFHLAEDGQTTVLYVARNGHPLDG